MLRCKISTFYKKEAQMVDNLNILNVSEIKNIQLIAKSH